MKSRARDILSGVVPKPGLVLLLAAIISAIALGALAVSCAGCHDSESEVLQSSAVSQSSAGPAEDETNAAAESQTEFTAPPPPAVFVLPEPEDDEFVCVTDYIPSAVIELKYAQADNFTGQKIYDFSQAYLRYGTVKKLMAVQSELSALGYNLKIWDAFRPYAAQCALWEICPDPAYVSNPQTGRLSHCCGNAVDVTIIGSDGLNISMPTGFDDFTPLADRDYSDIASDDIKANVTLLENIMERNGFSGYFGEWWHYADTNDYPIDHDFEPR